MLSIIIPARNAAGEIANTLDNYISFFADNYQRDFEIIVVPNGCSDNTVGIVASYCNKHPMLKTKVFEGTTGKGGAIIEGFKLVDGDIVSFVDADGATGPEELSKLIREVGGEHQVVIGSRWLPGSRMLVKQSWVRRLVSRGFNLLVRIIFRLPFKDTQCGAKVFTRQALADVVGEMSTTKFAFDVELLFKLARKGYSIREMPTVWENKPKSTLRLWKAIPEMLWSIVRVRLMASPFRRLVSVHNPMQDKIK